MHVAVFRAAVSVRVTVFRAAVRVRDTVFSAAVRVFGGVVNAGPSGSTTDEEHAQGLRARAPLALSRRTQLEAYWTGPL